MWKSEKNYLTQTIRATKPDTDTLGNDPEEIVNEDLDFIPPRFPPRNDEKRNQDLRFYVVRDWGARFMFGGFSFSWIKKSLISLKNT